MNINKPVSTFEAFCGIIADRARTNGDFALLLTENVPECAELAAIPEDKIVMRDAPAHSALLRAAGLALSGAKPWVLGRSLELMGGSYAHIREAVAMPALPVRIAAMDGGLSSASDGSAKQLFSDLALARTIPGMHLFVPSDAVSLKGIIEEGGAPLYMRLGRTPLPELENPAGEIFKLGGARILRSGTDVTICACGIMVSRALEAAERLERQNISAEVIDCYCLKPFPEQALLSSVRRTGCCVVAEVHSGIGGLFGAAAECLGRTYPVPLRSVSVPDEFINSGTPDELREYYGLTHKEIVDAAAQAWALRRR